MLVTDDLLTDLSIPHECAVPMGPKTWLGIGGRAAILAHPQSIADLTSIIMRCGHVGAPVRVLGAGANLLVADEGVDGVVVVLDAPAFQSIEIRGTIVRASAGVHLFRLINTTVQHGLAGLEVLAGIPATVGGAIRMNAGGTYGDIGRCVRSVTLMDSHGQVFIRDRDDLVFSYRSTNISARFILEAVFDLEDEDEHMLSNRYKQVMAYKTATQPMASHSAGCTFKNPSDDPDTGQKRPAGKLLDMAGLKGRRIGGAEVSDQHANFIVCHKGCTATDVLHLIDTMQREVFERFGVELEREVVVWP